MQTVTDRPIVTKEYEYKTGVKLSESVLTFDLSRPLAAILVLRENTKLHLNRGRLADGYKRIRI